MITESRGIQFRRPRGPYPVHQVSLHARMLKDGNAAEKAMVPPAEVPLCSAENEIKARFNALDPPDLRALIAAIATERANQALVRPEWKSVLDPFYNGWLTNAQIDRTAIEAEHELQTKVKETPGKVTLEKSALQYTLKLLTNTLDSAGYRAVASAARVEAQHEDYDDELGARAIILSAATEMESRAEKAARSEDVVGLLTRAQNLRNDMKRGVIVAAQTIDLTIAQLDRVLTPQDRDPQIVGLASDLALLRLCLVQTHFERARRLLNAAKTSTADYAAAQNRVRVDLAAVLQRHPEEDAAINTFLGCEMLLLEQEYVFASRRLPWTLNDIKSVRDKLFMLEESPTTNALWSALDDESVLHRKLHSLRAKLTSEVDSLKPSTTV